MLKVQSPRISLRAKEKDLDEVLQLYQQCHPGWPKRNLAWLRSITNLVIHDRGHVVAWSSYVVGPPPVPELEQMTSGRWVAWLVDTCVAESHRGQGLARILLDRRLEYATDAGCVLALGATWEGNREMTGLLETSGFVKHGRLPLYFPDELDGWLYVKPIGGR